MRFITVADRELRAAARRPATYRVRWITAVVFFLLLIWLLWAFDGITRRGAAANVFQAYSVLTFVYCIVIGAAVTADCLSAERREGTLGLLFLTNLNSAEIVGGKLCSTALTAVYGLAAILPMLALPLLMGGVTLAHFWKTVLALVVTTFFSMSAGLVASVICRRQFPAIAFAVALGLSFGAGLMGLAAALRAGWKQITWADELAAFSPLYALISAGGTTWFGANHYWFSLLAVAGLGVCWLVFVVWWLSRTWRDQVKGWRIPKGRRLSGSAGRVALRRRLLNINPFFWLGGRRLISSPAFMLQAGILVTIGSLVVAPYFARTITAGAVSPLVGTVFGWLWTGLAIHALTLYFAAMSASQGLAEDKQTGSLELILSTPTSERTISRGLWMAYGRKMLFPALLATLVHVFFIWQFLNAIMMEVPSRLSRGMTAWQVFWNAILNIQSNGDQTHWELGMMLRCLVLALGFFILAWITLGWVGRWLGLRMKHPGFAPFAALAFVFLPPAILFSVACYLADILEFDQWPNRQFVTGMMWLAVVIWVTHCVLLAGWARGNLRRNFRTEVMNRFQPASPVPWRRIALMLLRRLGIGWAVSTAALPLIVLLFYGYQNWQSQRRWAAFERRMKGQGQSLGSAVLSKPVPNEANFARSPAFQALFNRTNSLAKFSESLPVQTVSLPGARTASTMLAWNIQQFFPLEEVAAMLAQSATQVRRTSSARSYNRQALIQSNRMDSAAGIWRNLELFAPQMGELVLSARQPFFETAHRRNGADSLPPGDPACVTLEKVQRLFLLRACSALEMNRRTNAFEDVLTSLRLAAFARQSSDVGSTPRAQAMLAASLQPFWEGIAQHQWSGAQLVELQRELAQFNFLADYTNAVARVTLAYIENWRMAYLGKGARPSVPIVGGYGNVRVGDWQPRGWWLDYGIQLHQAAQNAIARIDVASGRVSADMDWADLNGLPLDHETQMLLQQPSWQAAHPGLVAFAQCAVNQAVIACALERHFLAHGQYPETLEVIQAEFSVGIPTDPMRGRPMSYERVNEHEYILRSVGPNEVDDRTNRASDDWLWRFPVNAAAVK